MIGKKTNWLGCLLFATFVLTLSAQDSTAQPTAKPTIAQPGNQWIIKPGVSAGDITAKTTLQDLVRLFGQANVKEQAIGVGEGETLPGVVIFPQDPTKKAEIIWKNAKLKRAPDAFIVRSPQSLWHTEQSIKIKMTLREIETLNGGPFELTGFDWDYGGTLLSFKKGKLAALEGKLQLRFEYSQKTTVTEKERASVAGDQTLSSANKVIQKLNPYIFELGCRF